ncbi:hypothetical protein BKA70DRAFT_1406675 [Coprinopsis sp. MPI-PUGE-AT-0042]|nr:hypothetical protein BKA70DRAFT_1406675 [Coprinopsis sp. MPI-PUGE-AT-0042]
MGAAISAARREADRADEESKQKFKEQLDFLVNVANNKLDQYQNELEDMFTDPASVEKRMVPGMRALRWERGYRVGVTHEASAGLNEIVDGFFGVIQDASGNGSGDAKKDAVVGGFKKIVGNALGAILGNQNAGQQEEQKFFIFMKETAIVRIDIKIWRYNFSGNGIMANTENPLATEPLSTEGGHRGVIDREGRINFMLESTKPAWLSGFQQSKLKMDEFAYLLSEYAGDDGVKEYVEKLIRIWTSIAKMQKFISQTAVDLELDKLRIGGGGTKVIENETKVKAITQ